MKLSFFSIILFLTTLCVSGQTAKIVEPKPGDTLYVNDTIQVLIDFDSAYLASVAGLFFDISVDDGKNWFRIKPLESKDYQFATDNPWVDSFRIVIPDSLKENSKGRPDTVSSISNKVFFRVYQYPSNYSKGDITDEPVIVLPKQKTPADNTEDKNKSQCGNGFMLSFLIPAILKLKKSLKKNRLNNDRF